MSELETLTQRQKDSLIKYTETMNYENRRFVFGPQPNKFFKDARAIFNAINVGCHAAYVDPKTKPNSPNEPVLFYVDFYQADKLIKVLSQLTQKSYSELTDGKYVSPQNASTSSIADIEWQSSGDKKGRKTSSKK